MESMSSDRRERVVMLWAWGVVALAGLAVGAHTVRSSALPAALGAAAPQAVAAHRPTTPPVRGTALRITVWRNGPAHRPRTWTMTCPGPGAACAVARQRAATLRTGVVGVDCTSAGRGIGEALVLGTLGGHPVDIWLDQRDSCDAAAWARLRPLLTPPA